MTAVSRADATWEGNLRQGRGGAGGGRGIFTDGPKTWGARGERTHETTRPRELMAAAHAAWCGMALYSTLTTDGNPPERLHVTAECTFETPEGGSAKITVMELSVRGRVPGLDAAGFDDAARRGEKGCPVSNVLLNNVDIRVHAELE